MTLPGKCKECIFSSNKFDTKNLLLCRRFPPTPLYRSMYYDAYAHWPEVNKESVCGEFKAKDGKQ